MSAGARETVTAWLEARAVAVLHNTDRRAGEELDSLQTLFLLVEQGRVAEVRNAVDDEEAVEAFWQGPREA